MNEKERQAEEAREIEAAQREAGTRKSFKVEPVQLSPEHARHYERFTGIPYDAEHVARTRAWVAFKAWAQRLRDRLKPP